MNRELNNINVRIAEETAKYNTQLANNLAAPAQHTKERIEALEVERQRLVRRGKDGSMH
jgi:hypothetical protein